jgi:ABC-type branched-subunit amino acid transport system ATPase component
LTVGENEAVGVIGPNGAGKTTALHLIAGRLSPDRGRVVFDGRDVTALPAHAVAPGSPSRTRSLTRSRR